jgi:hypothetical protein
MNARIVLGLMILIAAPAVSNAQVGGNIGFPESGARARTEQLLRARRTLSENEKLPSGTTTFVEANVLMNVKADESRPDRTRRPIHVAPEDQIRGRTDQAPVSR